MASVAKDTVAKMTAGALEAAALGSLGGTAVFLAVGFAAGDLQWSMENVLLFPVSVLFIALFALMIVLPCVAIFGGASAFVLVRAPRSALMATVVAATGGLVGWAVWALIEGDRPAIGICYGVVTGFFWYLRFPAEGTERRGED